VKARLAAMSPRAQIAVAGVTVLVFAAALWFLLVAPKRSAASDAEARLANAELRLVEAQSAASRSRGPGSPVADVFRLAKAMPASTDQPGLVLELSRLAKRSGVALRAITPDAPLSAVGGPTLIPVIVSVGGSYANITRFLRNTRQLVRVRDGSIHAKGRLFTIESVSLVESVTRRFPMLDATVALNAYVYDGPIVQAEVPTPESEEELSTSGTSAAGRIG
jgi:Tfp pilus assembly protein PilO